MQCAFVVPSNWSYALHSYVDSTLSWLSSGLICALKWFADTAIYYSHKLIVFMRFFLNSFGTRSLLRGSIFAWITSWKKRTAEQWAIRNTLPFESITSSHDIKAMRIHLIIMINNIYTLMRQKWHRSKWCERWSKIQCKWGRNLKNGNIKNYKLNQRCWVGFEEWRANNLSGLRNRSKTRTWNREREKRRGIVGVDSQANFNPLLLLHQKKKREEREN